VIIDTLHNAFRQPAPLSIRSAWEALPHGKLIKLRERATGIETLPMTYRAAEIFLEGVSQREAMQQRLAPHSS
jgi:hypothetical protein